MLTLAIESSCDEFSVALVEDETNTRLLETFSQIDLHAEFGGVIPELASREHVKIFPILFEKVKTFIADDWEEIDQIAVTVGPGLSGSLLVGIQVAKTLAILLNKPLIPVHHILGHIYSAQLTNEIIYPMLSLVVSGGHTELVYSKDVITHEVIGKTRDDAVGEVYDKVGRKLQLAYPGGPKIDKLAQHGKATYHFPKPKMDEELAFSFSGLKSSVINEINRANMKKEEIILEDICHSFQQTVVDELMTKLEIAMKCYTANTIVLCGGVSANKSLRDAFLAKQINNETKTFIIPDLKYCGDNAAMIGAASRTMRPLMSRDAMLKLECFPNISIEQYYKKINEVLA